MKYIPLILMIAAAILIAWWIFCIITKAKFPKGKTISVGAVFLRTQEDGSYYHEIVRFKKIPLDQENTLASVLKPTLTPIKTNFGSIRFSATKTGVKSEAPCFSASLISRNTGNVVSKTQVEEVLSNHPSLQIKEIVNYSSDSAKTKIFSSSNENICYVYPGEMVRDAHGVSHIRSATVLFYT